MFIYVKNIALFVYYAATCFLMLTDRLFFTRSVLFFYFPVMMVYYVVCMSPQVNMIYTYFVMEKGYARWKQAWQLLFHIAIYPAGVSSLLFLFVVKEIPFLIQYAETRLASIEDSLEEKVPSYRIAHLHHKVFQEDIDNRFHTSCFDSNRLYLLETTNVSRETQLGISNYRGLRKKNKKPRSMTEADVTMYKASGNKKMLLLGRSYYMYYPVLFLLGVLVLEPIAFLPVISSSLIWLDLMSYYFMQTQYHDLTVDLSYAAASVALSQFLYSKN